MTGGTNESLLGESSPHLRWTAAIPTTAAVLLTVAFFSAHQVWATGFFLPTFGWVEASLLYASILYVIVVTNTAVFGLREDRALVLNLIGGVLWTVTSVWLYVAFPFNFAHFADIVPWPVAGLVSWVTNANAHVIWAVIVLGMAAFIPFFALQLVGARRRLTEQKRT